MSSRLGECWQMFEVGRVVLTVLCDLTSSVSVVAYFKPSASRHTYQTPSMKSSQLLSSRSTPGGCIGGEDSRTAGVNRFQTKLGLIGG
jgi:hypothetical protein